MKRIMTLLITLMSAVPAFAAVNANSSWEEIVRDRDEIIVIDRETLMFRKSYTVPQCDTPTVD